MAKKFLLCFGILALAAASAAASRYTVTLFQPSVVAGTVLKPGDYKLDVDGVKATMTMGKTQVETPVKVESVDSSYDQTSIVYAQVDGKSHIREIRLGGTKTKLVFSD